VKDVIKIEITPAANGFIIEAHADKNGKVATTTYACESQQSVMRRLPELLKKLEYKWPVP
jgi:hypothetical protein